MILLGFCGEKHFRTVIMLSLIELISPQRSIIIIRANTQLHILSLLLDLLVNNSTIITQGTTPFDSWNLTHIILEGLRIFKNNFWVWLLQIKHTISLVAKISQ